MESLKAFILLTLVGVCFFLTIIYTTILHMRSSNEEKMQEIQIESERNEALRKRDAFLLKRELSEINEKIEGGED